jgi:ABC-2 type transport system ATP-binding protein
MPDAIAVRDLRKVYGDLAAVDGVSLTIGDGECFAFLGPNGAGKTTTVEILEGYRQRTAGTVSVLGQDPQTASRAWRAQIGIVLQSDRDLGDLTVSEAVSHFAGYYPTSRDVGGTIDSVGLSAKSKSRVSTLSGGQRRRLDVALGIIGSPRLLFLDEPTTGFDPEARREFWDLLHSIKGNGTTIVLTTHYLEEAESLADRVAVIVAGRIVAVDTPQGLGRGTSDTAEIRWRADGVWHRESTLSPTTFIADLARQLGGEIPDLTVHRPTLEDRYLRLIDEGRLGETS